MRNALIGTLPEEKLERISAFNGPDALTWSLQSHRLLTIKCLCGELATDHANHHYRRDYLCKPCAKASKQKPPPKNLVEINSPLLAEWNYSRNEKGPEWFTAMSGIKVWWIGKDCGHNFFTQIASRSLGGGCGVCDGKQVEPGVNDLATHHPQLVLEWHPTKNSLKPTEVAPKSNKRIWWLCENGHEWEQKPLKRSAGYGCGACSRSQIEKDFSALFREWGVKVLENDRKLIAPYELDFVLPDHGVALELNGDYWHSESEIQRTRGVSARSFHAMKVKLAEAAGYRLLFVWDDDWRVKRCDFTETLRVFLENPTEELPKSFTRLTSTRPVALT